jgi:LmbE family N-acetylglucosaminyl deacetylase
MKILAIGAHPDDVELGCGGVLAKAILSGHTVNSIIVSGKTSYDYKNNIIRTQKEVNTESYSAMNELGVTNVTLLDFPDKDIPYNSTSIETLDSLIIELQPDIIYSHWPFDTHQDHSNTSLSTISASRYFNSILMFEPISPSGRSYIGFRPQVYVDISDVIEVKINALKKHYSQYQRYGDAWIDAVLSRANHRGYEMGVEYAEAFEVMRYELIL